MTQYPLFLHFSISFPALLASSTIYVVYYTREQYEIIREDLENAKRKTKPRKYDLYDIFCGVLYVLKGGIQWRMLPADFPKWQLVYYYFTVWSKPDDEGISLLDRLLKKIGEKSA